MLKTASEKRKTRKTGQRHRKREPRGQTQPKEALKAHAPGDMETNGGKQTEQSGGEKAEESSPGNHRHTGPLLRLAGCCCGLVPPHTHTSHLPSSSRGQAGAGNSEGRLLGAEPWAVAVPAAEATGGGGGAGEPGAEEQGGRGPPGQPPRKRRSPGSSRGLLCSP